MKQSQTSLVLNMRAVALVILLSLMAVFGYSAAVPPYSVQGSRQQIVYTCSMHPEIRSSKKGRCPKCGMTLTPVAKIATPATAAPSTAQQSEPSSQSVQGRTIEAVKGAEEYTCTMHPEIRTTAPGKCPKCAMTLVPVSPAISEDFNLRIEAMPQTPKPGERLRLRFSIFNPRTGEQVKQFQVMHEKLFHLFIVSQDLSEFQHIHPEYQADGSFTIETALPKPGLYKIYSDIYPQDGSAQVLQQTITTAGYTPDLFGSIPTLQPDATLTKTIDGTKVELVLNPATIIAGQPVELKYHLTDSRTGEPVRDLVPYLGAWGHTLVLSDDQVDYVHSHPEQTVEDSPEKSKLRGGPDVTFNAFMPRPAMYRIWTQFQRGDTLTTFSFTVRVEDLR